MRNKARLTITLDHDLLKQIDRMVDNVEFSNRSQAIETLLRESLISKVTTAVLLAGGTAKQIVPALQPVGGEPLIFITLHHLISYGITRIFILAGPNESAFKTLLNEGSFMGATITYVKESSPQGTAGALKSIQDRLDETFLVMNADILTDIDLADFIEFHKHENTLATIAVKPRDAEKKYGKLLLQGNRITDFSDPAHSEGISIVNTGVYLLQPEMLNLIDSKPPVTFERDIFPHLAAVRELSAFFFQGVWFDISTQENYRLAQERWNGH